MSSTPLTDVNPRIADRLLADGRISRDDHARAVEHATREKVRFEEALMSLDVMSEADLLKCIATVHETRFVSTGKLSKAVIDPHVLGRIPVGTADDHGVFPVLYDDKARELSVLTADPDDAAALGEVQRVARVKAVRALVARPAAIGAAIAYHYRGDHGAFARVYMPESPPPPAPPAPREEYRWRIYAAKRPDKVLCEIVFRLTAGEEAG
jgi:hypothetical protein